MILQMSKFKQIKSREFESILVYYSLYMYVAYGYHPNGAIRSFCMAPYHKIFPKNAIETLMQHIIFLPNSERFSLSQFTDTSNRSFLCNLEDRKLLFSFYLSKIFTFNFHINFNLNFHFLLSRSGIFF